MKQYSLRTITFVIIISIVIVPLLFAGTWTLVIDKNGIKVFTRPVAGSPLDEFKGIGVVNAHIEVVGAVLRDVPSQSKWMPDCEVARVIEDLGNDNLVVYGITKAPWPVSNRDLIIKTVTSRDMKRKRAIIEFRAIDDNRVRICKGCVRIRELSGQWVLDYINAKQTRVTYALRANPGGSIPAWLANRTSQQGPYRSLLNLRKEVKKKKYIDAARMAIERFEKKK